MKTFRQLAVATTIAALPLAAFAQADISGDSLSRAQVRQEQIQLQQAGYNGSLGDQSSYPRELQAAEARVGAQQIQQVASGDHGGVLPGSAESGMSGQPGLPAHTGEGPGLKPVYFGH